MTVVSQSGQATTLSERDHLCVRYHLSLTCLKNRVRIFLSKNCMDLPQNRSSALLKEHDFVINLF